MRNIVIPGASLLLFLPSMVVATSVIPLSRAELARKADVVIVGRVLTRQGQWRKGRIVTEHRIKVEEVWAGHNIPFEVMWVRLGGHVGNIGQRVSGLSQLGVGKSAVLFLKRNADGNYVSVALAQSVLQVASDGVTLEPMPLEQKELDTQDTTHAHPMALETLRQAIRAYRAQ